MKAKRGFTLIELLVVLTIIALLIAITLPALRNSQKMTIQLLCSTRIRQAAMVTINYAHDNDDQTPLPQPGTYLTQFNLNTGYAAGAAALIEYFGQMPRLGVNWPPPLELDGDHRTSEGMMEWQVFKCPNTPDQLAWSDLGGGSYYVHTDYSAYYSLPGTIPGSENTLSYMPAQFPLWADNTWTNSANLNHVDASWHDYSGYTEPGRDIFIGMNAARADGSADWVNGRSARHENFFLAYHWYWWVIPKFD